jgi:putative NADH-flavin reductase
MKLVVLGSNGGIGREVAAQALSAGHYVTAVARRPEMVALRHERLQVVRADVMEPASLQTAFAGQEAVISAIGVASREPTRLYSEGIGNAITAMRAAEMRRLLCVSATGLDPGPWWQQMFAKPLLWRAFGNMYADLVRMEDTVRASGLDWTIVRPPRLTDKARTGVYQIAVNRHLTHGSLLSRADVADYMLSHLTDVASYRALVEIAY